MKWTVVAAGLLIGSTGLTWPAFGQTAAGDNIYTWPKLGDGMWAPNMSARFGKGGDKPPLTAHAAAIRAVAVKQLGGSGSCNPMGPVGIVSAGFPLKFYFTPGEIVLMSDMDSLWVRHVYMDGRDHSKAEPSYHGNSIGHWDGAALVIDTVALAKVNIVSGVPVTPTTHLVERYTLLSPQRMNLKLTVTDPAVLTAPWIIDQDYILHRDWQIEDTFCGEGNRDAPDAAGGEHVDLTPPPPAR